MTHAEMDELYELYALGALDTNQASEIDEHLASDCEYCARSVRSALAATTGLACLADPAEPPASVRKKLLAAMQPAPEPQRRRMSWLVPALAAACLALLGISIWSNSQVLGLERRLERVRGERDQLRAAIEVLGRSQTQAVAFSTPQTGAHGRVLVNPNGGFVVVGAGLPQIAQDRTYELWLVPAKGNPIPAGLFRLHSSGEFVHVSGQSVDPHQIAAVAVSVEPLSGSPQPTTKPILVVPLS